MHLTKSSRLSVIGRRGLFTLLSCFVLALILASCGAGKGHIRIKGHFKHLGEGELYAYSPSSQWDGFDTIQVKDGSFSISRPATDTLLVTLQYPNFMQTTLVAIPGKTIKVEGDASNMLRIKVSGSPENKLLTQYRELIFHKSDAERRKIAARMIEQHPASFASLAIFSEVFLNVDQIDCVEASRLLKLMQHAAPNRPQLKLLSNQLTSVLTNREGSRLPSFTAKTLSGQTVNDRTFSGHPLVISFWASWSTDFSSPLRQLSSMVRSRSVKLNMLNICLDADTIQCNNVIRRDTLRGYTVCDRRHFMSPLVRKLGLRYVPGNIVVNSQGVIIGRDLTPDQIFTKLGYSK